MSLDYKQIVQFLFPPSEDEQNIANTLSDAFVRIIEIRCTNEVYSILPYSDARVRSAIHLLKFHNHTHAKRLLSAVLSTYLSQTIPNGYTIIPVPLSAKRERHRGYNQVTEVSKNAIRLLPTATLEKNILIRTRHTPPQTSLAREARLLNVRDAFSIKNRQTAERKLKGQHVVLIDDVTTTGATLKTAKATLIQCRPASITCVALAH